MMHNGQKQLKECCKLGKNNPKNDANWAKTTQRMMQIGQKQCKK